MEEKDKVIDIIEEHMKGIIVALGLDLTDPNLQDTPSRVAKMYVNELFRGLFEEAPEIKKFPGKDKPVAIRDIPFYSTCAHHFMPFFGTIDIAYISGKEVVGLSKFNRVVNYIASRPQIQEDLTETISTYLFTFIQPQAVLVKVKAKHLCVCARGVKGEGTYTITQSYFSHSDKYMPLLYELLK